jgi:hypothetical protein
MQKPNKVFLVTVHYKFDGLLHYEDHVLSERTDTYRLRVQDPEACIKWITALYMDGRVNIDNVTINEE